MKIITQVFALLGRAATVASFLKTLAEVLDFAFDKFKELKEAKEEKEAK